MTLSPPSSHGVNPLANVQSVFSRTGVVAAADGDYQGIVASALTGATGATRYVGATTSGAPVAGTFAVGDLVIDRAGGAWTCTAAGTPGTWAPAVAAGSVTNTHIAPGAAIAASKIQSGGSGVSVLLSTTTLASDGVFDVSGIDQTYNDLIQMLTVRGTRAAANDFLQMRLNNDATASAYDSEYVANASAASSLAQTSGRISGFLVAASGTAGLWSTYQIVIPNYSSTAFKKNVLVHETSAVTLNTTLATGTAACFWNNTAAVTRVGFFGGTTANLLAGSILRIYGR